MSNDPTVRGPPSQQSQMNSFSFAPNQYPPQQRETQKNYVFVDEHNRHKRLKVMRACEGCRRRKIKCDAATTNTWPCSACMRLKLHCVRPNGYDGAADLSAYDTILGPEQFQQMPMPPQHHGHPQQVFGAEMYGHMPNYPENAGAFHTLSYDGAQPQHDLNYTTVPPPPLLDNAYTHHEHFPPPSLQQALQKENSPESHSTDSYQQQDLADLLGTLKVNEVGTAPYLRNKASFRRGEEPAVEEDDFASSLPPIVAGPGSKIRIPPELMPDEETAMQYFDLYFTDVHPYVPVLYKPHFYHQWATARDSISPLILEAIFAIGGRLAEEPAMGQQWLALASRHADSFMDVPRLSTLQALLMILKAREAAPKRGYFYRSWMTVVQCVQMAKDLGLDEHYEDHEAGRGCEHNPTDCQLRRRIWQTIFACEVMVGTPQGRHDLSVDLDTVDFEIPKRAPGEDETEYNVSRSFTYFVRIVGNVRTMSKTYSRLRKRKDWGIDPEFQQLDEVISKYITELPSDMVITFPPDNSPPWLTSAFVGNLQCYHYLTLILYHRPQLSFIDPNTNPVDWKKHMLISYDAAKTICRLQEAVVNQYGLTGLQSMQRGFSFTMYAGLSCVVIHLVAIVSPDPDFNTDAREFFARHMRIMEQVMEMWPMPELQSQINTVREAFSADTRKPFVLKPSFPYGSPHQSTRSSPPHATQMYENAVTRSGSLDQHLDARNNMGYMNHPITPPMSTGPLGSKNDSPAIQTIDLMPQGGQNAAMHQSVGLQGQPAWNPSRIFEQWNSTFSVEPPVQPSNNLNLSLSPGSSEVAGLSEQGTPSMATSAQLMPQPQYATGGLPNFVTPAMWQESVASVYEGGLKRAWDYDGMSMKRQ